MNTKNEIVIVKIYWINNTYEISVTRLFYARMRVFVLFNIQFCFQIRFSGRMFNICSDSSAARLINEFSHTFVVLQRVKIVFLFCTI